MKAVLNVNAYILEYMATAGGEQDPELFES